MAEWYAKVEGYYDRTSVEAENNATMIYATLHALGWSLDAICGLLGSVDNESKYNPWLWQGNKIPLKSEVTTDTSLEGKGQAYGLLQFDPPGQYIIRAKPYNIPGYGPSFLDSLDSERSKFDGQAQLQYVHLVETTGSSSIRNYFINTKYARVYDITYSQYITNAKGMSVADLASAWLFNYERPASLSDEINSGEQNRRNVAEYWYTFFTGVEPPDVPTPTPPTHKRRKMPLWMMLKPYNRRIIY